MISSLEFLINSEKNLVYEIVNEIYSDLNEREYYIEAGFAGLIQAAYRYNMFKKLTFKEFCIPYIIENIENVRKREIRK